MITEKDIKQAERNMALYIQEGLIKRSGSNARFTPFYLGNAKMSLQLADYLYSISTDPESKKRAGFAQDFECLL